MAASVDELIEKGIRDLNAQQHNYQKLSIIFNLIELRHNSINESDKRDLFLDIKKMIFYYVEAVDESYYGYYEISVENSKKILEKISYLSVEEQIILIELLQRKLKLAGFVDEAEYFESNIDTLRLKILSKKKSFKNLFQLVTILSTKNISALIISIFIVYGLYSIILLPAPREWMAVFNIKYVEYSSNFLLNHFSNTILSFCQIDSDFSITPTNFIGVISLILVKVSVLVLLFTFLVTELRKKFRI